MEFIQQTAKAIAGFIVGVAGVIIQRIGTGESVLPAFSPFDTQGWLLLVGVGILGYLGVYIPSNKLTAKQILAGVNELPTPQRAIVADRSLKSLPTQTQENIITYRNRPIGDR